MENWSNEKKELQTEYKNAIKNKDFEKLKTINNQIDEQSKKDLKKKTIEEQIKEVEHKINCVKEYILDMGAMSLWAFVKKGRKQLAELEAELEKLKKQRPKTMGVNQEDVEEWKESTTKNWDAMWEAASKSDWDSAAKNWDMWCESEYKIAKSWLNPEGNDDKNVEWFQAKTMWEKCEPRVKYYEWMFETGTDKEWDLYRTHYFNLKELMKELDDKYHFSTQS